MVLEFMQEQPEGATPKGIREALDLDQNQQSRACTALVKALALTTTGKTNKTRYHLETRTETPILSKLPFS